MGWTSKRYLNAEHTSLTNQQIKNFLFAEVIEYPFELVSFSFVPAIDEYDHNEVYMAVKNSQSKDIFAVVVLIDIKDQEIYWKIIEENMGPAYYKCSAKILELLTVTTNEYAQKWREKCKEKINGI